MSQRRARDIGTESTRTPSGLGVTSRASCAGGAGSLIGWSRDCLLAREVTLTTSVDSVTNRDGGENPP